MKKSYKQPRCYSIKLEFEGICDTPTSVGGGGDDLPGGGDASEYHPNRNIWEEDDNNTSDYSY